jgi:hypothetical protein
MTPEEIERAIQFISHHEAKVLVRIDRLGSTMERCERGVERHDREISQLTRLVGRLAQAEIHLVERMDAMAGAHKETDEHLNALIVSVERYIARRNGGRARGKRKTQAVQGGGKSRRR